MQWKRVAGTTIDAGLAGAASGPVAAVWYAAGTGRLLVETESSQSSRVFETADFIHWRLNTDATAPAGNAGVANAARFPEAGAKVQAAGTRLYAAGPSNVYASDDSGRTWLNLTGYNNRSIIGDGFTALATAPQNPQEITAANRFGVWRSADGGLSWRSLNEDLPNLMVRKLIDRRTAVSRRRRHWRKRSRLVSGHSVGGPSIPRLRCGRVLVARVSAAALSGTTVAYAGTNNGQLLVSHDSGATWRMAPATATGSIARIWVDGDRPDVALAAGGTHLYRTVNGGLFWDDVTGTLPSAQINGIAADRSAGVVYIATDRGVFSGRLSLNDAGTAATNWKAISGDLPAAAALGCPAERRTTR